MASIWMLTRALLAFTKKWASHYLRETKAQSRRPCSSRRDPFNLVALDNLVDLIVTCLTHPAAANQTFLVSDGEDVSTTELLRRMGRAMGRPARLIPVPASWLKLAAAMVGKPDVVQRLRRWGVALRLTRMSYSITMLLKYSTTRDRHAYR